MSWRANNDPWLAKFCYWASLFIASLVLAALVVRGARVRSDFVFFLCIGAFTFGLDYLINRLTSSPK